MSTPMGISSIVGCSSIAVYGGYSAQPTRQPDVRLDCGCGARKWQRHKPGSPCAYCGREPEVVW